MFRSGGEDGGRQHGGDRRRGKGEGGAALLEFALVAPLLFLFLYAIVAYGMVLVVQHGVTQAAADAARAAVPVSQDLPSDSGPSQTALDQANVDLKWLGGTNACSQPGFSCTTSVEAPCPDSGSNTRCLEVTITYDYEQRPLIPSLPGLGLILPSTLRSSTTTLLSGPVVSS